MHASGCNTANKQEETPKLLKEKNLRKLLIANCLIRNSEKCSTEQEISRASARSIQVILFCTFFKNKDLYKSDQDGIIADFAMYTLCLLQHKWLLWKWAL